MKIRFEPRQSESKTVVFLSPLVAVLFTGLFSMLIFAILGVDPITAVYTFFIGPVTSIAGWAELFCQGYPISFDTVSYTHLTLPTICSV